jgi:hypothetical protein
MYPDLMQLAVERMMRPANVSHDKSNVCFAETWRAASPPNISAVPGIVVTQALCGSDQLYSRE